MMAADYRHIDGLENRLGRHYSRFPPFSLTPALADQSLALRKLRDAGSNRRSRVRSGCGSRGPQFYAAKTVRLHVVSVHAADSWPRLGPAFRTLDLTSNPLSR